jgi:hypothetical protein
MSMNSIWVVEEFIRGKWRIPSGIILPYYKTRQEAREWKKRFAVWWCKDRGELRIVRYCGIKVEG